MEKEERVPIRQAIVGMCIIIRLVLGLKFCTHVCACVLHVEFMYIHTYMQLCMSTCV